MGRRAPLPRTPSQTHGRPLPGPGPLIQDRLLGGSGPHPLPCPRSPEVWTLRVWLPCSGTLGPRTPGFLGLNAPPSPTAPRPGRLIASIASPGATQPRLVQTPGRFRRTRPRPRNSVPGLSLELTSPQGLADARGQRGLQPHDRPRGFPRRRRRRHRGRRCLRPAPAPEPGVPGLLPASHPPPRARGLTRRTTPGAGTGGRSLATAEEGRGRKGGGG